MLIVTVWLSPVTSTLAGPGVAPAVNVAVATPLTKLVAPETVPPITLLNTAGNSGRPFSSVVRGAPEFLCLMSAVSVAAEPEQSWSGLALILSWRNVIGNRLPTALRKSFADGPVFIPHQLSFAVKLAEPANSVRPFKGLGTVFPTSLENVTDALPLELMAPPVTPAELPERELVVRVSGPLSTTIAPPLPFGAVLPENVELLIL